MKNVKRIGLFVCIGTLASFCCKCQPPDEVLNQKGIIANIAVTYQVDDWQDPSVGLAHTPYLSIYGNVTGNTVPLVQNIYLNDNSVIADMEVATRGGAVFLQSLGKWRDTTSDISLKINTDMGSLSGEITLPDSVYDIDVYSSDSLNKGDSLVVEWKCAKADFFIILGSYNYTDSTDKEASFEFDTTVVNRKVVFPAGFFPQTPGDIEWLFIYPANGPFPIAGAEGNMNGEGSGFLHYSRSGTSYWNALASGYLKKTADIGFDMRSLQIRVLNVLLK